MSPLTDQEKIQTQIYEVQLIVNRLRREVFTQESPRQSLLDELESAEAQLSELEKAHQQAIDQDAASGQIINTKKGAGGVLGPQTTGLQAVVHLRMKQYPSAISHLFDADTNPLVSGEVTNFGSEPRPCRVRITSFIEGYSAQAVSTLELPPKVPKSFSHLPTLFPEGVCRDF